MTWSDQFGPDSIFPASTAEPTSVDTAPEEWDAWIVEQDLVGLLPPASEMSFEYTEYSDEDSWQARIENPNVLFFKQTRWSTEDKEVWNLGWLFDSPRACSRSGSIDCRNDVRIMRSVIAEVLHVEAQIAELEKSRPEMHKFGLAPMEYVPFDMSMGGVHLLYADHRVGLVLSESQTGRAGTALRHTLTCTNDAQQLAAAILMAINDAPGSTSHDFNGTLVQAEVREQGVSSLLMVKGNRSLRVSNLRTAPLDRLAVKLGAWAKYSQALLEWNSKHDVLYNQLQQSSF